MLILLVASLAATPARAQDDDTALLMRLFGPESVSEDAFANSFLSQVPFARVKDLIEQVRAVTGPPVSAELLTGNDYMVHTMRHDIAVVLVRDEAGRISGLLVKSLVAAGVSVSDALSALGTVGGTTAYLVTRNGETLHASGNDMPLAVGSAYKLGVLAAMRDRMLAVGDGWDKTVRLEDAQISLPTGILHTFPIGSPLTLATLAALMISISDNTAADVLIDYAGRKEVAARLGLDFVLKTREMFILKADGELQKRYLASDAAKRYAMTDRFNEMAPPAADKIAGQHVAGIEFYVSLDRLCALVNELSNLEVMSINPGVADPVDWARVAYKGGSERGVLNFTTQVQNADGDSFCVATTWNDDTEIDETAAISAYASLIKALAAEAGAKTAENVD